MHSAGGGAAERQQKQQQPSGFPVCPENTQDITVSMRGVKNRYEMVLNRIKENNTRDAAKTSPVIEDWEHEHWQHDDPSCTGFKHTNKWTKQTKADKRCQQHESTHCKPFTTTQAVKAKNTNVAHGVWGDRHSSARQKQSSSPSLWSSRGRRRPSSVVGRRPSSAIAVVGVIGVGSVVGVVAVVDQRGRGAEVSFIIFIRIPTQIATPATTSLGFLRASQFLIVSVLFGTTRHPSMA